MDKPQLELNEVTVKTIGQITDAIKVIADNINTLQKAVIMLKERVDKIDEIHWEFYLDRGDDTASHHLLSDGGITMSDLRIKPNTDNGDLPKDYKNITLEQAVNPSVMKMYWKQFKKEFKRPSVFEKASRSGK